MTMFSAEDRRFTGAYGGGGYVDGQGYGGYDHNYCSSIGSDHHLVVLMADQDDSRTESSNLNEAAAESTSNKDQQQHQERDDEGWLNLSIGGCGGNSQETKNDVQTTMRKGLVELELLPSSTSNTNNNNNNTNDMILSSSSSHSQSMMMSRPLGLITHDHHHQEFRAPRPVMNFGTTTSSTGFSPSFFLQQHPAGSNITSPNPGFHHHHQQQQEINWGLVRPMIPINMAQTPPYSNFQSSSASLMAPSGSYFPRPFQLYAGVDMAAAPGPNLDFRVIPPPRRPHSGIWFMLQASSNQEKEPFLPQISKSYLRIKDGRMTIRLVIKYLVNKLNTLLQNESEVEVRCKGQRLLPFLTLQHVRDNIWGGRDSFITLLPNSSTTDHIMVLHYGRIASN